jgi:aerobic carbon-monoxide dehydrogenase large subunit
VAEPNTQPRLLGARVKRREDPRFLTGRARFVDDIVRPGMLHAAFARSAVAHAELGDVRIDRALAAPGVRAALTGTDVAARAKPITCDSTFDSWQGSEYPALAVERVRFVGQTVACVLAEDRYLAEDACELVAIEYRELPPVTSIERAIAPDAPRLHEHWADNYFVKRHLRAGDPESAFHEAAGVVELRSVSNRHSGIPLENRGCIAEYDADRTLTLWTATQIPHLVRTGLADVLGMSESSIRVIAPDVGGGFGIKAHLFPEEIAVCLLAIETGLPVKWIEDRSEHLLASIHAREHHHHVRLAYAADGELLALWARLEVDCGAYSVYPFTATMDTGMALGILPGPYRIRHYECEAYSVATNKCPLGPYRGVSRPAACFTIERAIDEVAHALGIDPVDVRRRNLIAADEFPYESITGLVYDSGSFHESLDKLLAESGYEEIRRTQRRARSEGRFLGVGIACYTEQTAHTTTEFAKRGVPIIFGYDSATVRMDPSGAVNVRVSTHSHGQGHETTMAQVVADALVIPLEHVRVTFGDTDSTPYGHGTFASRSAVLAGGACTRAAETVKEMLLRFAGERLEAAPDDLELADGRVRVKGSPSASVPISELARLAYHRPELLPEGMEPLLEAVSTYDAPPGTGTFANAAHLALIEVDIATGGITVLGYWVVEDCGQMINPLIVEGQVHGGVAQGIGGALFEELIYDDDGQLTTTTLMDYRLPGAIDIPHIAVSHLESLSPFTIAGIKGMGEGGSIAPGPALAGALADALSPLGHVVVDELPLTPERVRRFVARARAGDDARR